jgi:hypothetical protein
MKLNNALMKCGAVFNLVVVCDAAGLSRKCLSNVCDHSQVIRLVLPKSQIFNVQNLGNCCLCES